MFYHAEIKDLDEVVQAIVNRFVESRIAFEEARESLQRRISGDEQLCKDVKTFTDTCCYYVTGQIT